MSETQVNKFTLDALYKIVYPQGIENAIPEQTICQGLIPFKTKIGEEFKQPVILTLPGGITYGGENASSDGTTGAYDLGEAISAESCKLAVKGYQMTVRELIGYGAAKSAKGGAESFKDAVGHVIEAMALVGRRVIECDILHGQNVNGIGDVESTNGSTTITITAATWAPGIFIGCKGRRLLATQSLTTLRAGSSVISSVNFSTRTITVDATPTSLSAGDELHWGNLRASD